MENPFDHEYETAESQKFKSLAAAFQGTDTMGLSERFSILAALCDEKAKILQELAAEVVSDDPKAKGKLLEWPGIRDFSIKKKAGDN